MNDKQRAAEAIEHEVARLQGLIAAAQQMKTLGDLEQCEQELRGLIAQYESKLTDLRGKLQQTTDLMNREIERSKLERAQIAEDSKSIIQSASATAKLKIEAAERKAAEILEQAHRVAKETEAKTNAKETRYVEVCKEIAVKEYTLQSLKNEMAEVAKKHMAV